MAEPVKELGRALGVAESQAQLPGARLVEKFSGGRRAGPATDMNTSFEVSTKRLDQSPSGPRTKRSKYGRMTVIGFMAGSRALQRPIKRSKVQVENDPFARQVEARGQFSQGHVHSAQVREILQGVCRGRIGCP